MQTLDITANKASKNEEISNRLINRHRKLTLYVYKMQHEKCQKTLKLWDMAQCIAAGVTINKKQKTLKI